MEFATSEAHNIDESQFGFLKNFLWIALYASILGIIASLLFKNFQLSALFTLSLAIVGISSVFLRNKNLAGVNFTLLFAYYPLVAISPLLVGRILPLILLPLGLYLILIFTGHSQRFRIMAAIGAIVSLIAFIVTFNFNQVENGDYLLYANLATGILVMILIFLAAHNYLQAFKKIRDGLNKQINFYNQIIQYNPHYIFTKDRDRKINFVNQTMAKAFNLPASEVLGFRDEELFDESPFLTELISDDLKVLKSGKLINKQEFINSQNTNVKWVQTNKSPIYNDQKEIIGLLGVSIDITDKKNREGELAASLVKIELVLENIADAILFVDSENQVAMYNKNFLKMWNLDGDQVENIRADVLFKLMGDKLASKEQFLRDINISKIQDGLILDYYLKLKTGEEIECYINEHSFEEIPVGKIFSFKDVTNQQISINALSSSEASYKYLFENAVDGLSQIDLSQMLPVLDKLKIEYPDKSMLEIEKAHPNKNLIWDLVSLTKTKIINKALLDITACRDLKEYVENLPKMYYPFDDLIRAQCDGYLRGEKHFYFEKPLQDMKGQTKIVQISMGYPNDTSMFVVTIRDITQRKKNEIEIKHNQSLYVSFFEQNNFGVLHVKDGRIIKNNQSFSRIIGYSQNEINNMNWLEIIPEKLHAEISDLREKMKSGEVQSRNIKIPFIKKDGSLRLAHISIQRLNYEKETYAGSIATISDITELKTAEDNLRASEERYRNMFMNAFDAILLVDEEGVVKYTNPGALNLFKLSEEDKLVGQKIEQFIPKISQNEKYQIAKASDEFKGVAEGLNSRDNLGNEIFSRISMATIQFQNQKFVMLIIKDISQELLIELKESELKTKKLELERLQREITSASLFNSQKNRLLTEIRDEINQSLKGQPQFLQQNLRKIIRTIEGNLDHSEYWLSFKLQFENVHPGFFSNILKICPDLTNNDLKHCAFVKMNMTAAEVGSILFVESKSVEMARYRIKSKLKLKSVKELREFLLDL